MPNRGIMDQPKSYAGDLRPLGIAVIACRSQHSVHRLQVGSEYRLDLHLVPAARMPEFPIQLPPAQFACLAASNMQRENVAANPSIDFSWSGDCCTWRVRYADTEPEA